MFGWWKRDQGFEWREYVRTTILLRRKDRREKIDRVGKAAVGGLKAAGQKGSEAGLAGAGALGRGVKAAASRVGEGAAQMVRAAGPALARAGDAVAPAVEALATPHVRMPLAILGGAATAAGLARLASRGFDSESLMALSIGAVGLLLAGLPWLFQRDRAIFAPMITALGKLPGMSRLSPGALTAAAIAAVAATLCAVGYFALPASRDLATLVKLPTFAAPAKPIEGKATAAGGDRLRIGSTVLRLAGIEAPERNQQCQQASGKKWRCGEAAEEALAKLVKGRTVTCIASGAGDAVPAAGNCRIGTTDIAAELVRAGHVFAEVGLFAPYAHEERQAKDAKAGIWKGEADRPQDYRAKRWEEARRAAPEGCPIKGRVSSGQRVYVLPWSQDYEREKVRSTRGERWFCTEAEALAAGWRPQERS